VTGVRDGPEGESDRGDGGSCGEVSPDRPSGRAFAGYFGRSPAGGTSTVTIAVMTCLPLRLLLAILGNSERIVMDGTQTFAGSECPPCSSRGSSALGSCEEAERTEGLDGVWRSFGSEPPLPPLCPVSIASSVHRQRGCASLSPLTIPAFAPVSFSLGDAHGLTTHPAHSEVLARPFRRDITVDGDEAFLVMSTRHQQA
jgi:hypothetical protein